MKCHNIEYVKEGKSEGYRFLLMGNPNVGKSVVFSKLTGKQALSSNYAGTTVTVAQGEIDFCGSKAVLIDVPGVYSLEAISPAEEVAVDILQKGADMIICVLDATNLERNLYLALQLVKTGLPIVFALNFMDILEQKGLNIDTTILEKELGWPVIPTAAISNQGLRDLLATAFDIAQKVNDKSSKEVDVYSQVDWEEVERVVEKVQKQKEIIISFWDRLGEQMIKPFPGLPIAFLAMMLVVAIVVGGGKAIRSVLLLPLIDRLYVPVITRAVDSFVPTGIFRNFLVGEYGILIKGVEWPFGLILPYVFLFYIVLSLLEDTGYLPRLGVLLDGLLNKLGIHGGNIIPLLLGYGCAVPAILGTRAATTIKERLVVSSLVCLAVPCVSQTGAFIALLGARSWLVLILVYAISLFAIFLGGLALNRIIPGQSDAIVMELPNLLVPDIHALKKKIFIRTKHFMLEAEIPMFLGIGVAAFIAETGILNSIAHLVQPVVTGWLGLPKEASISLILGVIRRELAVLPLLDMDLNTLQLLVGAVVALFYIPCLSVLGVLVKEFGVRTAILIMIFTIVVAFVLGGIINNIGTLIYMIF